MENARFTVDVRVDERTLHEVYLPHFKMVLDAGVAYAGVWSGRRYRAYAAADNLGDRVHATSVSLIGGTPLLAPGAPLTRKAGVQFDF